MSQPSFLGFFPDHLKKRTKNSSTFQSLCPPAHDAEMLRRQQRAITHVALSTQTVHSPFPYFEDHQPRTTSRPLHVRTRQHFISAWQRRRFARPVSSSRSLRPSVRGDDSQDRLRGVCSCGGSRHCHICRWTFQRAVVAICPAAPNRLQHPTCRHQRQPARHAQLFRCAVTPYRCCVFTTSEKHVYISPLILLPELLRRRAHGVARPLGQLTSLQDLDACRRLRTRRRNTGTRDKSRSSR